MRMLLGFLALMAAISSAAAQPQTFGDYVNSLPPATIPLGATDQLYVRQGTVSKQAPGNLVGGIGGIPISGVPAAGYLPIATSLTAAGWSGAYFPGLTTNVERPGVSGGTGMPGLDLPSCTGGSSCGWAIFQQPTSTGGAVIPGLSIQRNANYTGGSSATVVSALNILTATARIGSYNEWGFLSELLNQTEGTSFANNVAVQGTATKQYAGGFSNEIGPTWASNFNCVDLTGRVNPTYSCLGAELDTQALASAGTDVNRQRVALQLAWFATNMMGTSSLHFGVGMLMGAGDASTMDHGIYYSGNGAYGNLMTAVSSGVNGINLGGATFSGAAIITPNLVIDGTGRFTIGSGGGSGNAMTFTGTGVGNLILATGTTMNGVDLNGATFSGAAFLSPGFAVSGNGAITATLPASAGGGGLFVCVDTGGNFYQKATCP